MEKCVNPTYQPLTKMEFVYNTLTLGGYCLWKTNNQQLKEKEYYECIEKKYDKIIKNNALQNNQERR